jgi:hypothetical protein
MYNNEYEQNYPKMYGMGSAGDGEYGRGAIKLIEFKNYFLLNQKCEKAELMEWGEQLILCIPIPMSVEAITTLKGESVGIKE